MFRKPLTWPVLTALFCGSVLFIGRFFGLAFPIVSGGAAPTAQAP